MNHLNKLWTIWINTKKPVYSHHYFSDQHPIISLPWSSSSDFSSPTPISRSKASNWFWHKFNIKRVKVLTVWEEILLRRMGSWILFEGELNKKNMYKLKICIKLCHSNSHSFIPPHLPSPPSSSFPKKTFHNHFFKILKKHFFKIISLPPFHLHPSL